jgi:two-component system sensor histidine kinase PhoQ
LPSPTLRKRLAFGATLVLVVALGIVGLALNAANHRGAVSALKGRMDSYVYLVLAAMEVDTEAGFRVDEDFADPRLLQPGSGVYVAVSGSGQQWRSRSALGETLGATAPATAGEQAFEEPSGGADFYSLRYGIGWQLEDGRVEPYTVTVWVDPEEIRQQTSAFRLGMWRALFAAGAILVVAQLLFLFAAFRPLGRVAGDVARVESGRAERLDGEYPRELEPLVRNVNRLLATEQSNQQRIRNALDSLAHSLKTPLAVLQAGLRQHPADGRESMQQALDEMSRLIATRLQRAGSTARRALAEPVPVAPQVERMVASLQKVHSHRMISTEVILEDELEFYGEQRDLMEVLGNLLDNAFKYGRGRVRISGGAIEPGRQRPGLWLRIEDDGPGISAEQWNRLVQRGVRGDERVEGHGLGLAIVSEVVTAYGGRLELGSGALGGAAIRVSLPPS